ncbi:uncharacterized protein Pyn_16279 [Prunus yedoensis var. nudiflora]|uniref:Transposase MuDR plant domain-containing protein n=1 Tax=Prunus yedoensis var. nudiflora TaxID=2094558 RepID=A0A314ZW90_PRUYE|nr:uncharacterized protein Pyn_16279 [Prunus yedoensis var. nudiflora]
MRTMRTVRTVKIVKKIRKMTLILLTVLMSKVKMNVNHPKVVEDPNAPVDEDRESTDVAKSDVESLDSSSYDEDDGNQKKRKRKLPKFHEFRPETDLRNPVFKLGLRFATTDLFRKAIRNYSIINRRMIKFKCNDRDRVRAVCAGNCNWVCFASAVNGSEWVQVKKLVDVHDCGTVEHNFHANSTWSTTIPWWDAKMKKMRDLSQAAFDWVGP